MAPSQVFVEKRSKKRHEADASISTPQTQATTVFEDKNKNVQEKEKPKPSSTHISEDTDDNPPQTTPKVISEEERSEKKKQKKRKIKKTSTSGDDHQVDHSNAGADKASSPKRQRTVSESHKPVSFFFFTFLSTHLVKMTHSYIYIFLFIYPAGCNSTPRDHFRRYFS